MKDAAAFFLATFAIVAIVFCGWVGFWWVGRLVFGGLCG